MKSTISVHVTWLAALTLSLGACSESGNEQPDPGDARQEAQAPPATGGLQAPPGQGAEADEQGALMAEYQQIQQRIGTLQQQAMADPALQASYASLQSDIEEEMAAADPAFAQKQDKLETLQEEMSAAQQSGDQEAVQEITEEGRAVQSELQTLRADAMGNEEIAADVEAFRESIEAKMAEIDPEAPELIERATEIANELQAQAAGGE